LIEAFALDISSELPSGGLPHSVVIVKKVLSVFEGAVLVVFARLMGETVLRIVEDLAHRPFFLRDKVLSPAGAINFLETGKATVGSSGVVRRLQTRTLIGVCKRYSTSAL
jgi:hypothetical protein